MKSIYRIVLSAVATLSLLTAVSCSQDEYIYTPDNNCVTFQDIPSSGFKLDGNSLVIELTRGTANADLALGVTLEPGSIYTIDKTTVNFPKGEYKASVTLSYDEDVLEAFVEYPFVLKFDANEVSPTGISTFKAIGQVPFSLDALEYEDYGTVYCENYMFGKGYDFDGKTYTLQVAKYTKNYYRIKNLLGSGIDFDFFLAADGTLEITAPVESPTPGHINSYDLYQFPTEFTHNGEQITLWFDTDADYIQVRDQGEEGYTMIEGTYFSNYSVCSVPSIGLLTADLFRDDYVPGEDDGWWRFYINVDTVF